MPQALDSSGATIDVPPDELVPKWQSGEITLPQGSRYDVRLSDGRVGTVPAESLADALRGGATPLATGAAERYKTEAEYGGNKGLAIAAASGFGEQASLGLVEHLLPDSYKSAIEKAQALHPIATGIGEAGGMMALGAATGGVGLEGGIAGLAERGAAGVIGEGAESFAARVAQRAAVHAVGGVAGGAQYGAAKAISENALDPKEHQLTAESILSDIGSDMLWGGVVGAGFGAVGAVGAGYGKRVAARVAGVARGASTTAENVVGSEEGPIEGALGGEPPDDGSDRTRLDKILGDRRTATASDVGGVAASAVGAEPSSGLGQAVKGYYSRLASVASGASADDIGLFLDSENRAALLDADQTRDKAVRDIRANVDDMMDASRLVQEEGQRTLKRSHIRASIDGVDPVEAAESARNMVDHTLSTLHGMLAEPDTYGGERPLQNALKVAEMAQGRIERAITGGDVAEQYALLDDLKKGIGKYTVGAKALSPRSATDELVAMQQRSRAATLADLYDVLREGLEDQETWKAAGAKQKAVNAAWTTQIDASKRFNRALTTEIGRDPGDPWVNARGADPAKLDAYVRNLNNPAHDLTHQAVRDYVSSTRTLADAMAEQWELPPDKLAQVQRLGAAADNLQSTLDRTSRDLSIVNAYERIRRATTGNASSFLGAAGYLTHGLPGGLAGAAIGKVAGLFTRPAEAIMHLARIEGMVRRADGRISRAVKGILKGAIGNASQEPLESYERRSAQVKSLYGRPQEVQSRIADNIGKLARHSPQLSLPLSATVAAGLALLNAKLPPQPPADPIDPNRTHPAPSISQREEWLRYYRAVVDPISVVEDAQSMRLSPEGVEVLRTVYPSLYGKVQSKVYDELAAGDYNLTKQQRIGIALLLDLPTPDMSPGYIVANQATYPSVAAAVQSAPSVAKPGKTISISQPKLASDRVEGPQDEVR